MDQIPQLFIILLSIISLSFEDCSYSNRKCVCKNIALNDVLPEIFEKMPSNESMTSVELHGVPYPEITCYLYPLHENYQNIILDIKIINCSVESIGNSAFKAFANLEILDLSYNKIENISFIKYLPTKLKKLSLRNNYITSVENVFSNLKYLEHIDFSNCKIHKDINFLVFKDIHKLEMVNISHNNLLKSTSESLAKNIQCVDISYNVFETLFNIPFRCINVSYTSFPSITVKENKKTLLINEIISRGNIQKGIAAQGNKKEKLIIEISSLDHSFAPMGLTNLEKLDKVKILKKLTLRNLTIPALKKSDFDLKKLFYQNSTSVELDLSLCSIKDIEKYYFKDYTLRKLNLSGNSIKLLQDYTFENAEFFELDLSNSNIEKIESFTFDNLKCGVLNLSRNMLTSISLKNINSLKEIDLSFNKLTTFDAKSVYGIQALDLLNLRNNLLSSLNNTSVQSFKKIMHLDIRDNKLINIDGLFSCNLKITTLNITYNKQLSSRSFKNYNNNIKRLSIFNVNDLLESHYFKGLLTLEELYIMDSDVKGVTVDSLNGLFSLKYLDSQNLFRYVTILRRHVFKNLKSLPTLDLSSLEIQEIEDESFDGLQALSELNLSNNKLINLSSKTFVGLENLRSLNLSRNILKSLPLGIFSGLELMKKLDISYNSIKELETGLFSGLNHLQYLDLSHNSLENLNAENLFTLAKLLELYINENRLTVLDYKNIIRDHSNLSLIDINNNQWNCRFLYLMLQSFKEEGINFLLRNEKDHRKHNVAKIYCTNECNKDEYCSVYLYFLCINKYSSILD